MQKPGKDQNLDDQKRILREEFLEELVAFEGSSPVAKETVKSLRKRRKLVNLLY